MFFFFKQKTAYEMRISDWSSDVCSSDLEISGAIADNRGNVEKLIADAALTMENLRQATGDLESMAASLQTNVETLTTRADDTLVAFESMASRSEERRVGKEWVSTCRSRWSQWH